MVIQLKINEDYKQTKFNVTSAKGRLIPYIVIHNTGTNASAKNNCMYFSSGDRGASADFFIDKDGSIYQFNGDIKNYYSWHCGDGAGRYGITNGNSIGIEVVSAGEEFTQAQKDALKDLVTYIKKTYGSSTIARHYDASRKSCPMYYVEHSNAWNDLKEYISSGKAPSSVPEPTPTNRMLKKGDKGEDVKILQNNLNKIMNAGLVCDGDFGTKTLTAVKNFQKTYNLVVDGIFGDASRKKMDECLKKPSSYLVKIKASVLNVRKGAGTNYPVVTTVRENEVFTIVETKNGWGKLKSGIGWISLDYTSKV